MARAKQGDNVSIHYTVRRDDGTVFDSSGGRNPLEFTLGEGKVMRGFEVAVQGMEEGQVKTVTVPSDQAYGEHRDNLVVTVSKQQLPEGLSPKVGQQLQMRTKEGRTFQAVVTAVESDAVELDANHPLAGRDLTFEIELVRIG